MIKKHLSTGMFTALLALLTLSHMPGTAEAGQGSKAEKPAMAASTPSARKPAAPPPVRKRGSGARSHDNG